VIGALSCAIHICHEVAIFEYVQWVYQNIFCNSHGRSQKIFRVKNNLHYFSGVLTVGQLMFLYQNKRMFFQVVK